MQPLWPVLRMALGIACAAGLCASEAIILDRAHASRIFGETRRYRIFLPPDYETSGKRYPVIYWFHGWGERYNEPTRERPGRNYDSGNDYGGDTISAFVGAHDAIVVKWDGYNPRSPGEKYPRPYNISPVETDRQFPFYFPELVDYIDAHYRTIADREHRATAGLSMGGFMSFWISGKYPDLVSSASNFMGSSEFFVGPRGMEVEYRHEEMRGNYDGLPTRLVTGARDFIQFYHRRMNLIWTYSRPFHETEDFDFDHGTPGMAKTLQFHMQSFAHPLPRPAVWSHVDVYPEFAVWGWDVKSDRHEAGFTELDNVSASGFRSSVRRWLPGGRLLSNVKLQVISAPLYPPGSSHVVTIVRLRDGEARREKHTADTAGRLVLALDGDEYETGIGSGAILALAGFELDGPAWAVDNTLVRARVRFWNKGGASSGPLNVSWETSNPDVWMESATASLPELAPGKSAEVPLVFKVLDDTREIVTFFAAVGGTRLPLEIPMFPRAPASTDFSIADGRSFPVFQGGVEIRTLALGNGDGNGRADAGETIAILFKDSQAYRAAELFSNDPCVDLTTRVSDVWSAYDHVGASAKYSLPAISRDCSPGHIVHLLARVQEPNKPNHRIRYAAIQFPVGPLKPDAKSAHSK